MGSIAEIRCVGRVGVCLLQKVAGRHGRWVGSLGETSQLARALPRSVSSGNFLHIFQKNKKIKIKTGSIMRTTFSTYVS